MRNKKIYWVENSEGRKVVQYKTVEHNTWRFTYRRKSVNDKWQFVCQYPLAMR